MSLLSSGAMCASLSWLCWFSSLLLLFPLATCTSSPSSPSIFSNASTFADISGIVREEVTKAAQTNPFLDWEFVNLLTHPENNELLVNHSHYFENSTGQFGRIYSIGLDSYTATFTPQNLSYTAHSAVGYGLANSIILVNSNGFVLIDSGSHNLEADDIILAYQEAGVLPRGDRVPLEAIIYTHNHIDHTGGSVRWVDRAQMAACPMRNDGVDGTYYARSDCVEVICHEGVVGSVVNTATRTGQQIDVRSAYMYGVLSVGGAVNNGIGPQDTFNISTFHPPSKTFSESLDVRIHGMQLILKYTPSETSDEIVVFVPDGTNSVSSTPVNAMNLSNVTIPSTPVPVQDLGPGFLAAAEVIQGPSFPNLYSLRGTTFRNPLTWYESVDQMRMFDAWAMVPSHGVPLMGQQNIQTVLTNFRDAVQYVHDQTLRFMRLGYVPDELVTMVQLPQYILSNLESIMAGLPTNEESPPLDPRDYLRTFYGSVPQGVRILYSGYLGWNEGDPTFFHPLPPTERANRYVKLLGGARRVYEVALDHYKIGNETGAKEEFQWAAELLKYVLSSSNSSAVLKNKARVLKGKAFLRLARTNVKNESELEADWFSLNPNWRNWFIVGAEELALHVLNLSFPGGAALSSSTIKNGIPPQYWVQQWCWRFNAKNNSLDGMSFGWEFEPNEEFWGSTTQKYVLQVAREVVRLISDTVEVDRVWANLPLAVSLNYTTFVTLIASDKTFSLQGNPRMSPTRFVDELKTLLEDGSISILNGTISEIVNFYDPSQFDAVPGWMPNVVERPLVTMPTQVFEEGAVAQATPKGLELLDKNCNGGCILTLIIFLILFGVGFLGLGGWLAYTKCVDQSQEGFQIAVNLE